MILRTIDSVIQMLDADLIEGGDLDAMISGVSTDSRSCGRGTLFIPLVGERFDGHDYAAQAIAQGAGALLWQKDHPDHPHGIPVIGVDDTLQALQKLASAYRDSLDLVVIGITGSNGKTSVKDILSSMLSRRYVTGKTKGNRNNEIGVPLTLLELSEEDQVAVVEMGMENRGEIDLLTRMVKPDIAIITNVGEAHLENLGSLENIARAKAEIVHGLKENGVLLYNGEQPVLSAALAAEQLPAGVTVESFGSSREQDLFSYGRIQQGADGLRFCTNLMAAEVYMNVYGAHQVLNALPAIYAAKALGLSEEEILAGLAHIEKTGMRNDVIAVRQGWILDDSYKSNRQSALAALKTLHDFDVPRRVAALSDMLDMGEAGPMLHYAVGKAVAEYGIDRLCTWGEMSRFTAQGAINAGMKDVTHFETKEAMQRSLMNELDAPCMILVKGSRGMHMDSVVDCLTEKDKGSVEHE